MRHKELDRTNRMFSIDKDLDEFLRKKYPGLASNIANQELRNFMDKENRKVVDLIGHDTNAGRLAYSQAMEKVGQLPNVPWKSLSGDLQLQFLDIYKKRLAELQSRGF